MEALDGGAKGKNITIEQAPVRTQPLVTDGEYYVDASSSIVSSLIKRIHFYILCRL